MTAVIGQYDLIVERERYHSRNLVTERDKTKTMSVCFQIGVPGANQDFICLLKIGVSITNQDFVCLLWGE